MGDLDKEIDGLYNAAMHYADTVRRSTRRKVLREVLEIAETKCANIEHMRFRLYRMLQESLETSATEQNTTSREMKR